MRVINEVVREKLSLMMPNSTDLNSKRICNSCYIRVFNEEEELDLPDPTQWTSGNVAVSTISYIESSNTSTPSDDNQF